MSAIPSPPEGRSWRPSAGDRSSSTWSALMAALSERLAYLRAQNDSKQNDETTTAFLRGEIAELKRLLDLNKDLPQQVQTN